MEFEVSYSLEDEQQFWDELDEIVSASCDSEELIDNALRAYLSFTTNFKQDYLHSEYDVARCSYRLLHSSLFQRHKDYVRRQIVYSLLQEENTDQLHFIASLLLFDGKQNEQTLELLNTEGAFPRLIELIQDHRHDDLGLHRMLLELLYEMSRIQRIRAEELRLIDDAFVLYLFQLIEELSDDVNDPYHYPVIRVLLVLNEQYMVIAHEPGSDQNEHEAPLTNRVIKALSNHGSDFKTFGENIILLLNRESETSLQLLILKLLYLLFTTRATYEYFYTNDLRVLVDVMIRNLVDLPDESQALRHTYLRVLYPLLAHSQLRHPPHYKKQEVLRLLKMLANTRSAHFAPVDETTVRLVARCLKVPWLAEDTEGLAAKRMLGLGMPLAEARASSLSVVEVAAQNAKPGVITPSREKDAIFARRSAAEDAASAPNVAPALDMVHRPEESGPFEVQGSA